MASSLVLLSERQIQTQIISRLIAQLGITDINPGSVNDILTQAFSQQIFGLYYQLAQVTRLVDIDSLSGSDLDNKAFEYGLTRFKAGKTKDSVNILRADSFVKVSTTFYAGSPAPISGATTIDVNDASNVLIGTTGTLILGRGTNNLEEVNYSVAPTNMVTFWRFTLTTPLAQNHAIEETVILKQGIDQVILAGTVVVVPASGVTVQIQFTTDSDVTLLSGEKEIDDVEVTAAVAGSTGNIPIGAIQGPSAFTNAPFPGAQAENINKFTNGRDLETDDQLRDRVKAAIPALSKGIKAAIQNAIVGLVDPETAKRVVSASIVLPLATNGPVKIYIDDGTGFEPSFKAVGFESLIDSTTGGEQRLQIAQFPIVKAQLESTFPEPYDLSSGALTLQYEVGNVSETITFQPSFFATPSIATAEEIVTRINALSTLLEARTSQQGRFITINAKADSNEALQITGGTSNPILGFPLDKKETINLYKDDVKLSKDGLTALLDSQNSAPYDLSLIGSFPQILTIVVDAKTANPQTATFNLSDASDSTAVTAQEICNVINRDISGVQATPIDSNTKVRIQSLTALSSKSFLHITGGTLNNSLHGVNFSTTQVQGANNDFTFNRELGIIELTNSAGVGDSFTLNSLFTRGKIRASSAELYSPSNGETLVISVDGGSNQVITFDASFVAGKTADDSASFVNAQLQGATAIVREVSGINYLEINTNTYDVSGSIQIQSSSTGNSSFGFTTNITYFSNSPNKAFLTSSVAQPYSFAQNDSLVVVVDDDIVNKTFSILMNYAASVTTSSTSSVFRSSVLPQVFAFQDDLKDFYVAFTSGLNTDSGTIDTIASLGGGIFRYHFSVVPGTFSNYATGDLASFASLTDSENNGFFVITNKGSDYIDVSNPVGVVASAQTGTSVLSERRRVLAYNQLNGQITVSSSFSNTPLVSDPFIVIPSTVVNLVKYINNVKITSFSLKGIAEGVFNETKLQLSSQSNGSDGSIQVTGGNANRQLTFSTIIYNGIQAYEYWTGLTKLVHETIYGDDTQLEAFPGVGAAGITFQVLAPTVNQLIIQLQLTLANGVTIGAIQNEVKSAVSGYVNTLGVGDDVIIEQIRAAVIAIPGVTDVVINSPISNVAIADNQRADVSDPNILIG